MCNTDESCVTPVREALGYEKRKLLGRNGVRSQVVGSECSNVSRMTLLATTFESGDIGRIMFISRGASLPSREVEGDEGKLFRDIS